MTATLCAVVLGLIALWQTWSSREWRRVALLYERNTALALTGWHATRDVERVAVGVIDDAADAVRRGDSKQLARVLREGITAVTAAEETAIAKMQAAVGRDGAR